MLKKITISLLLILGAAASCGALGGRGEIAPGTVPKVIAEYQPGQARPTNGYCSWSYYDYDESYCWLDVDRETIYYTIDRRTGKIARTTYTTFHRETQIGELVVVWGEPTWVYMSYGTVEVIWQDRSAWVMTTRFNVRDKVWMITYFEEPPKNQERWSGFQESALETLQTLWDEGEVLMEAEIEFRQPGGYYAQPVYTRHFNDKGDFLGATVAEAESTIKWLKDER